MARPLENYTGLLLGAEEISALTKAAYGTPWPDAIIEDYTSINTSLSELATAIVDSVMIVGTGSPEGAVKANESRQYFDASGAVGSRLFINPDVGADTGWVAIN